MIEATALDAPPGPFDAATCILVRHVIPDDGSKARTLEAEVFYVGMAWRGWIARA